MILRNEISHILFICTGNIFRSMSAELSCRSMAATLGLPYRFSSAGTDGGVPRLVDPHVHGTLSRLGIDSSAHRPRLLTAEILENASLVVAMHTEHQDFIREQFGRDVPLYREIAGRHPFILPDVHDAVPDYETNRAARNAYIAEVIESIAADSMAFLKNMPRYGSGF